jgi:hypothetical protein
MSDAGKPTPSSPGWIVFWAILALLAVCWQGPGFLRSLYPEENRFWDFSQEWFSAQNLVRGQPVYQNQADAMERYTGMRPAPDSPLVLTWNAHPPTSVLLAVPFTPLDYPTAHLAWDLVSLFALAIGMVLVGRHLGVRFSPWMLLPTVALFLVCSPVRSHLSQGQLSLVLLPLIVGAWAADRTEHPWWAGVLLGAAAAIKLFPGFLFLYFLLRRRWQALAAGAITVAALTGVTLAVEGWQSYHTYITEALPSVAHFRSSWYNESVFGFWARLFDPAAEERVLPLRRSPALAGTASLVSVGLIVLLLVPVTWRAHSRAECDRAFAVAVTAMLLVSPISWNHYFPLLLLPVAWLWLHLPRGWPRCVLGVVLVLLWLPGAYFVRFAMGPHAPISNDPLRPDALPWQSLTALSVHFYALLGLFALGLFEAWRPVPSAPDDAAGGETAAPVPLNQNSAPPLLREK